MTRIGFLLKVKPEKIDEYKARHTAVWPEMLDALRSTGWHNYSLFLRNDGMLIGYVETQDFDRAVEAMSKSEVNARWQREMRDYFEGDGGRDPDRQLELLQQVFYLP